MLNTVLFYLFALLILGGGILTITRRNAVHSAICLIVSLLGVAGIYLLQGAEFLFAVQIVLYIGGIMVLFLFVIMLVTMDEADKERQFNVQWLIGILTTLAVGALVMFAMSKGKTGIDVPALTTAASTEGNVRSEEHTSELQSQFH